MQRYSVLVLQITLVLGLVTLGLTDNVTIVRYYDKANPGKCTVPQEESSPLSPGQFRNLHTICGTVKCLNSKGKTRVEYCDRDRYGIPDDEDGAFPQLTNPIHAFPRCCQRKAINAGSYFD